MHYITFSLRFQDVSDNYFIKNHVKIGKKKLDEKGSLA